MQNPANPDPPGLLAMLWCLDEVDDQIGYIGGQLLSVATAHSPDALGITVEQFMTSDDDTGQAGEHNPADRLADTLCNELCGHIARARTCAVALVAYLDVADKAAEPPTVTA